MCVLRMDGIKVTEGNLKGLKGYFRFGMVFVSVTQPTVPKTHIPTPAPGTGPVPHNLLVHLSVLLYHI